jgi:hypothetical protein
MHNWERQPYTVRRTHNSSSSEQSSLTLKQLLSRHQQQPPAAKLLLQQQHLLPRCQHQPLQGCGYACSLSWHPAHTTAAA